MGLRCVFSSLTPLETEPVEIVGRRVRVGIFWTVPNELNIDEL